MIESQQLEILTDAAVQMHAADSFESLGDACLSAVRRLIDCDFPAVTLAFGHQMPGQGLCHSPMREALRVIEAASFEFREQSPIYVRRLRSLLHTPASIHQFTDERSFAKTDLHANTLRRLGVRRHMVAINPGAYGSSIALWRSRGSDFSVDDTIMLHQIARQFDRAVDRLVRANRNELPTRDGAKPMTRFAWLVCDDDGLILRATPDSLACLRRCVGVRGRTDRVPIAWRDEARARRTGAPPTAIWCGGVGNRMSVHPVPIRPCPGEFSVSFVEYLAAPDPIAPLLKLGLTRREAEVIGWAIEGKTNPEIAMILGISGATAKKHMENIFHKLGVENRTTAVTRALEAMHADA